MLTISNAPEATEDGQLALNQKIRVVATTTWSTNL